MDRLFEFRNNNKIISVNYSYSSGHEFGQGLISPNQDYNFINIPKNASSSVKSLLTNWHSSNYYNIKSEVEHLVILRDPTDRWISAIAEFLVGNFSYMGNINKNVTLKEIESSLDNKFFQNLLFDFVIFDAHTLPQCCFLKDLNLSNITFFYHDEHVVDKIKEYLKIEDRTVQKRNTSDENEKKRLIIFKLKELLSRNPELQQKIDIHYYADSALFDLVKFH
jgi:hypothetical protein